MSGLKRELKAYMVNGVFSRRQTIEIKKSWVVLDLRQLR